MPPMKYLGLMAFLYCNSGIFISLQILRFIPTNFAVYPYKRIYNK